MKPSINWQRARSLSSVPSASSGSSAQKAATTCDAAVARVSATSAVVWQENASVCSKQGVSKRLATLNGDADLSCEEPRLVVVPKLDVSASRLLKPSRTSALPRCLIRSRSSWAAPELKPKPIKQRSRKARLDLPPKQKQLLQKPNLKHSLLKNQLSKNLQNR